MPLLSQAASFEELSARHGPRLRWLVLLVVGLGVVSALLATTSFTVAVPSLMTSFGVDQSQVQWTVTGYMAAMTVGMLPASWLLDHLGFRRLFLAAVSLMAAAGVAGALASSFAMVIALRVVQGAAAGVLQPLGTIAVMRLFDAPERGRASGILGFGIVLAPATAPTLGGLLLDRFGWPAIFLLNLPACLLSLGLGLRLLPRPQARESRSFDWIGLALLTVSTLALVEGMATLQRHGLASAATLALVGVALAGLAGFIVHARRCAHPLISLAPFEERSFAMGTMVTFTYGFGLYASAYMIPVFLQHALGMSATAAGLALLPSGLVLAATIPLAGRMADRLSPVGVTVVGLALFCLAFVFFAVVAGHISYTEIVSASIVSRVGLGLVLPALSIATLRHLEQRHLAASSVVASYARQLGGVMGVAVAAVFLAWREAAYQGLAQGVLRAFAEGFAMVAVVFALSIAAAGFMRPARPGPARGRG